jgi:cyclopropane fatty-acyl-phospholipid synthase-like methyltransferase
MKNIKAQMFNEKASDPRNKPDEIIEAIGLKSGQTIADIGSGGGYFSLRFAEIIGEAGKVYAVDTNPEFLQFIRDCAKEKGLNNIITLLIEDKLILPEKSLDLVFMRNVTVSFFESWLTSPWLETRCTREVQHLVYRGCFLQSRRLHHFVSHYK